MAQYNNSCPVCGVNHIPGSKAEQRCLSYGSTSYSGDFDHDTLYPSEFGGEEDFDLGDFEEDFDFDDMEDKFDPEYEDYSDYVEEYSHEDAVQDMVENLDVPPYLAEVLSERGFYRCAGMEEYDKTLIEQISEDYKQREAEGTLYEDFFDNNSVMEMSGLSIVGMNFDDEHLAHMTGVDHDMLSHKVKNEFSKLDGVEAASVHQSMNLYTGAYFGYINEFQRSNDPRRLDNFYKNISMDKENLENSIDEYVSKYAQDNGISKDEAVNKIFVFSDDDEKMITHVRKPPKYDDSSIRSIKTEMDTSSFSHMREMFSKKVRDIPSTQGIMYDKDTGKFDVKLGRSFDTANNGEEFAKNICKDINTYVDMASKSNNSSVLFRGVNSAASSNISNFSAGDVITMESFSSFSCSPNVANQFVEGDADGSKPGMIVAISSKSAPVSTRELNHPSKIFESSNNKLVGVTEYDEREMLIKKNHKFELLNRFEQTDKVIFFVRDAE